jgi:hypothetical protein
MKIVVTDERKPTSLDVSKLKSPVVRTKEQQVVRKG